MFFFTSKLSYIIILIYIIVLMCGLYLVIKYEKNPIAKILWIIFNFIMPFIGSLITIINFSATGKKKNG
jgi:hypothetical protein